MITNLNIYSLISVLINEDNRSPNGLVVTHLPEGPTAYFKLRSVFCYATCSVTHKGCGNKGDSRLYSIFKQSRTLL